MSLRRSLIFFAIILPLMIFAVSTSVILFTGRMIEDTKLLMGTIVRVRVPLSFFASERKAREAVAKALEETERLEGLFSVFDDKSEVSRINRLSAGEKMHISDDSFSLIESCVEYNRITGGAFDITIKPLVDLWNICRSRNALPSRTELDVALSRTGSRYIILDRMKKEISFEKDGMAIDFGGAAKGYATDRAIGVLKENGIRDAVVSSGGNTYCLGRRSVIRPWNTGIRNPEDRHKVIVRLPLQNMAIDTAGDYENYFILDGKRYCHIIDPVTGYPVRNGTISASVIAKDALAADMLATALCVLGNNGMNIINSNPALDAIIIRKEDFGLNIEMSKGLKGVGVEK